jgi:hypothetical protein
MRRVKFDINETDGTGVKAISLVDNPAIKSDFIAFSEEEIGIELKFEELKAEGYKQVVAGLALIPDKDILRSAPSGEKYLGYFTTESIERIRNKFHKELMTNRVNTDHRQDNYIDAFLIESFIIDSPERLADLKAKGISTATEGSWFVAYKIEDEKTFKRVLDGELRGFSVEIFVSKLFKSEQSEELKVTEGKEKSHFERRLKINRF